MGRIYVARLPETLDGLGPQDILTLYPYMKLDIQVHEKECPVLKKEDGPAGISKDCPADSIHEAPNSR